MANLNILFDFTKYERRKQADQRKFETDNEALISAFIGGVHSSFKKLHTVVLKAIEPIDQDKNLCATVMSGYLAGFFKRRYASLCWKATKQRFRLCIDNTNVFVKKLDEKTKLPSNIPTDESMKIYHQLTDNNDKECNIFLGYTVNEAWSMITGVFAVCIEGNELLWVTDLNNFGESTQTPTVPILPTPTPPKVKPGIRRKKAQDE